jgi:hypothetical protein
VTDNKDGQCDVDGCTDGQVSNMHSAYTITHGIFSTGSALVHLPINKTMYFDAQYRFITLP